LSDSDSDVVVVDVANVIGSRPDGWWRDRAGAARRLYDQVLSAGLHNVTLVVEGAARAGVEAGQVGGVRVVHAPRSGDDAVVAVALEAMGPAADEAQPGDEAAAAGEAAPAGAVRGRRVTVVTSDRELRRRVVELGADVVGPRWFLVQLR
jgi:hypothetical protein